MKHLVQIVDDKRPHPHQYGFINRCSVLLCLDFQEIEINKEVFHLLLRSDKQLDFCSFSTSLQKLYRFNLTITGEILRTVLSHLNLSMFLLFYVEYLIAFFTNKHKSPLLSLVVKKYDNCQNLSYCSFTVVGLQQTPA